MSLFDLPPEEKRKPSKRFWQKGSAELIDWVHEPDFYIIYRIGHDFRVATIFFGLLTLAICFLHKYGGFFPELIQYPHRGSILGEYFHLVNSIPTYLSSNVVYPEEKSFVQLYVYLINGTGPLLVLSLIYYGVWFKKKIHFREYNILRQRSGSYKNISKFTRYSLVIFLIAAFFICFFPASISSIYYMQSSRAALEGNYDSSFLVVLMSLIIAWLHPMTAAVFFKLTLICLYAVNYEIPTEKEDLNR